MPKNCKGCVRYKLLTMYQYVQNPFSSNAQGVFLWTPHLFEVLTGHGAEGLSSQVWMIGKEAIHASLNEGFQLCGHVAFC